MFVRGEFSLIAICELLLNNTYSSVFSLRGMLESDDKLDGLARLIVNFALKEGSSKQGNALRASVGENCVLTIDLRYFNLFIMAR